MSYRVHTFRAGVLSASRSVTHCEDAEQAFDDAIETAQRRANQVRVPFRVEMTKRSVMVKHRDVLPARADA